ncbi:MAG: toxin HipA [Eubacteriales bacterium]|nr:toxin HipA [Eubacteriales bacterium]
MAIRYTTEAKKYILLKGNIAKRMEAERVSDEQMAATTGMSATTYKKKKVHPEMFTYPELRKIFIRLKFPEDEILEALT